MVARADSTTAWSRLLDVRNLVKVDPYKGERSKFGSWKNSFYNVIRIVGPKLQQMLEYVENHPNTGFRSAALTNEEKVKAENAYNILSLLTEDDANDYIKATPESNGFEAWRTPLQGEGDEIDNRVAKRSVAPLVFD